MLALFSAALFALGSVLQQREAMQEPEQDSGNATILLRLARHPVWLAGIATYALAYGVQCAALGILLGLILFDESIHRDALDSIAAGVSLAAMFTGVALLALRPDPEPEPLEP